MEASHLLYWSIGVGEKFDCRHIPGSEVLFTLCPKTLLISPARCNLFVMSRYADSYPDDRYHAADSNSYNLRDLKGGLRSICSLEFACPGPVFE